MVGIIGSNLLGTGSLVQKDINSDASSQKKESVSVNIATGNLVIQDIDDTLVSHGADMHVLRTYNSQGALNTNGKWWLSTPTITQRDASTLIRTDRDGQQKIYAWDSARNQFVATYGDGAFDTITRQDWGWSWRDGSSGMVDAYAFNGVLLRRTDTTGNTLHFTVEAGSNRLLQIKSDAGEIQNYEYYDPRNGNLLTAVHNNFSNGTQNTRIRYTYDDLQRLQSAIVDLTPDDNSISDGNIYQIRYNYDGGSERISQISQSDGSVLKFTYTQKADGSFAVATIVDALNRTTSFNYLAGLTQVTDAMGNVTHYQYDGKGQISRITGPAQNGKENTVTYQYSEAGQLLAVTDAEGLVTTYRYDNNGNLISQTDSAGNAREWVYNSNNQKTAESVRAAGSTQISTTRYVVNEKNQVRFVISPEGSVKEFRYNVSGEISSELIYLRTH